MGQAMAWPAEVARWEGIVGVEGIADNLAPAETVVEHDSLADQASARVVAAVLGQVQALAVPVDRTAVQSSPVGQAWATAAVVVLDQVLGLVVLVDMVAPNIVDVEDAVRMAVNEVAAAVQVDQRKGLAVVVVDRHSSPPVARSLLTLSFSISIKAEKG